MPPLLQRAIHTDRAARLLHSRRVRGLVLAAVLLAVAIHVVLPRLPGIERTAERLRDADPWWLLVAFAATVAYLACYVVTLHGSTRELSDVPEGRLDWKASYEITMAGQAASTVITAAGAGGIALVVWALRQAGASTLDAGRATAGYLVLHYGVFLLALLLGGGLLYAGVLPGAAPVGLTLVPAVIAAACCVLALVISAFPDRMEARLRRLRSDGGRVARLRGALLGLPASLAGGMHVAHRALRGPGGVRLGAAAVGVWATQIAIFWSCLRAFGADVALGPVAMAFFVGSAANLLPLLPGGVGSVEAGLIGTLLAFGEPGSAVVIAVLAYRLISYWIPTIPEVVAYGTLRRRVSRWQEEDAAPEPPGVASPVPDGAAA